MRPFRLGIYAALRACARGCPERNALGWRFLQHDPALDALRGNVRFEALSRRIVAKDPA